jgi:predicted glycosyltransferase
MKILFSTFHPVDPQVVRYVAEKLQQNGHDIFFVVVEKEGIIYDIINSYGFKVKKIGKSKNSLFGKILNVLLIDFRLFLTCLRYKPNIIFSPASPYTGHVAKLLGINHICWGDTETAVVNLRSSLPFVDSLLLPSCFYKEVPSDKTIFFNAYKEIAYLHPNYFHPDNSVLRILNISDTDKIILMRFSALRASHDIGLKSKADDHLDQILYYIKELSKYAKVFISCTEKDLGPEFEEYRLNIHPSQYIHLLSFCSLYVGEGTTTASEAGVLGVPWINIQETKRGYLIDQEINYELGFRTNEISCAFETALKWIQQENIKELWHLKRQKLLADKIDFTAFLVWFIENYPNSYKILKNNPEYQNRFK